MLPDALRDLPPIPRAAQQVLALSASESVSATDLARAIEGDPRMTVQLLRVANSAYFKRLSPALTIRDAIVTVGSKETARIAIGCALLSGFGPSMGTLDVNTVLEHGLAVSQAWAPLGDGPAAAGVLVDAGVLALTLDPPGFERYLARVDEAQSYEELHGIEREVFGLDRCGLGEHLVEIWKLPPEIGDPLTHWHICRATSPAMYDAFNEATAHTDNQLLAKFAGR